MAVRPESAPGRQKAAARKTTAAREPARRKAIGREKTEAVQASTEGRRQPATLSCRAVWSSGSHG